MVVATGAQINERALAEAADLELQAGTYVRELWKKAWLESAGNMAQARQLYIESRVASLLA